MIQPAQTRGVTAVNQESPHDPQRARPRQDRSSSHCSPSNRRPSLPRPRDGVLAAAGGSGGEHPRASAPTLAGAIELVTAELVRQLGAGLEAVVTVALETVLERNLGPALHDRQSLAQQLRCGVDTVDKLRREGMPELRVGDAPRFELEIVLAWLRTRGQAAGQGAGEGA